MADKITVKTNHVPRDVIDSSQLTAKEREEFSYHNWTALENGEDSADFFRYKGETYDVGEFMTTSTLPEFNPLTRWDGYHSDSFFSGIVIRYVDNGERIIVGTFYA